MIKEYIIRTEALTPKQAKALYKTCEALAREYEGEFYTKSMKTNFRQGMLTIKNVPKNVTLINDRIQR